MNIMTNKQIAGVFDLHSKLLLLHDGNAFKVRSYQNAYNLLRQLSDSVNELELEEILEIPGIGKSIANKIIEICTTESFSDLEEMLKITPDGVVDLMKLKGLGPKKIKLIWKELGVESLGELDYAINENRLTLLKGFGKKTQENLKDQIVFLNSVKGFYLINKAEVIGSELIELLKEKNSETSFFITGELRRNMPYVSQIDILSTMEIKDIIDSLEGEFELKNDKCFYKNIQVNFIRSKNELGYDLFVTTGPEEFVSKFKLNKTELEEIDIFKNNSFEYIKPVFRDKKHTQNFNEDDYISNQEIKGVIHNHTVWSDGSNKVLEMAEFYKNNGYQYMVVTDHSKSAFYANGVRLDQINFYLDDISKANSEISDFTIFSGIESDILINGDLDYDNEILNQFDCVIASVHSVLRMDKEKATNRLLNAIKNPYTKILGHMTGRILLAREGYPLDYDKVFEACAKYKVSIELNANPHRLDIDWTLISKAQDMGVIISINPDAHSKEEVGNMKYGVFMAQKGGLLKENCLNIKNASEFKNWLD